MNKKDSKPEEVVKEVINNPGLTALYVKWAVPHLLYLDKCIRELNNFSNINLWPAIDALQKERAELIKINPAYKEAQEIIDSIKDYISIYKDDNQ